MKINSDGIRHYKQRVLMGQRLTSLQMDFTGRCNLACPWCAGMLGHTDIDMPLDKAKEIFTAAVGGLNLNIVALTCQGEFSVWPHATEFIAWADATFRNLFLSQDTNAVVIPDGYIEALNGFHTNPRWWRGNPADDYGWQWNGNMFDLSVSIWGGNREDYMKYHGKDRFREVEANIDRYFTEITNPNVRLRFSAPYINHGQMTRVVLFLREKCRKYGRTFRLGTETHVPLVVRKKPEEVQFLMRSYFTVAAKDDAGASFTDEGFMEFVDNNGNAVEGQLQRQSVGRPLEPVRYGNCIEVARRIIVTTHGDIAPCWEVQNFREYALGNVYEQPVTREWLLSLYESEKFRRILEADVNGCIYPQCAGCMSRRGY